MEKFDFTALQQGKIDPHFTADEFATFFSNKVKITHDCTAESVHLAVTHPTR